MSEEWGVRFEDWGQPHTNWRHLDWPCGPHKFFWSSLTANQLITTCASLHTAASSHCQLFYSETGQYGRIVHLEEYRQPSPPVRVAFPSSCLVRWAKAAPSLFTSLSARCASRQGNQKGLARRKFLGPHSPPLPPSSCCQTHIVGQTQGWWQPLTNLPLAVTFASLPLDQWGTNIHASRWSLPIRRNLPPFFGSETSSNWFVKEGISQSIVAADFLTPWFAAECIAAEHFKAVLLQQPWQLFTDCMYN